MNNNIEEDYVSFETAKLLKEKGFAPKNSLKIFIKEKRQGDTEHKILEFNGSYDNDHLVICDSSTKSWQENFHRPTQSLAIKWLRENFNIDIEITTYRFHGDYVGKKYKHLIYNTPNSEEGDTEVLHNENSSNTFEEAREAALLYTLQNLIP